MLILLTQLTLIYLLGIGSGRVKNFIWGISQVKKVSKLFTFKRILSNKENSVWHAHVTLAGVKTLMYFEGCANPHLGATILLRGGSQNELRKVKNVTSMMIFAAYSCRLEKSFLMDEFAMPPSPKDNSFLDESSRNASPSKTTETIGSQSMQRKYCSQK